MDFSISKFIFHTRSRLEAIVRESLELIYNKEVYYNDVFSYDIHVIWKELMHNR